MHSHQCDVIVVGGGVAGLAAATFMARQDKTVLLLEQAHDIGGRARTKQQDGFLLNQGPHALYRGGRGIEVLRELGVEVHGKIPQVSGAYAIKGGVKHTFPAGFMSLLTTGLFGASAKFEAIRFLASLPTIDGKPLMSETLRDWIDSRISHPDVRGFLLTVFRIATYTNAPELMSAGAAIEQLQKALAKNVLYLDGGWQTIVDGLSQAATRAGVRIETEAHVAAIPRELDGAVRGVRLADGRSFSATSVVVAASPVVVARLVERSEGSSLARWAREAIPVRAACLDVALRTLPDARVFAAFGIDQPLYLSAHSVSARLAPEGCALIHVAKYLSPDDKQDTNSSEREMETLLDLVQPGWRDALVYRRFLPDMIVMNAMPTASGNGTPGRPGPEVPDVPGLYVVGDWVGREGMLVDASLASAEQVSKTISASSPRELAAAS